MKSDEELRVINTALCDAIKFRDERITELKKSLLEKGDDSTHIKDLQHLQEGIKHRDIGIINRDDQIEEQEIIIGTLNIKLSNRDAELKGRDIIIAKLKDQIESLLVKKGDDSKHIKDLQHLKDRIKNTDVGIINRDEQLKEQAMTIGTLHLKLSSKDAQLKGCDITIARLQDQIDNQSNIKELRNAVDSVVKAYYG